MTSSMLTVPYMTSLLDQAKTHYTITDKFNGEVLGYAFMLVDGQVTPDQVQLLPWHAQGDSDNSNEESEVHPPPPILTVNDNMLIPAASLASDLDISDDSSMNATVEDFFFSPRPAGGDTDMSPETLALSHVDFNANNVHTSPRSPDVPQDSSSKVAAPDDHLPSQTSASVPISVKSVTQSIAAQIAAQLTGKDLKDKTDVNVIGKDVVVVKGGTEKVISEDSLCVTAGKRSSGINMDFSTAKKVKVEKLPQAQFSPGKPGRFSAFYTTVGVEQPVEGKHKRVRCLLCTEEKILSSANFGDHCRSLHEPPVQCEGCGREYSAASIRRHIKKCPGKSTDSLEVNINSTMRRPDTIPEHVSTETSSSSLPASSSVSSKDAVNRIVGSGSLIEPKLTVAGGCSDKEELGGGEKITFIVSSANVERVWYKIEVKKGAKIKKVMKKFGKKVDVSSKKLRFMLSGQRLSGEELAGDLKEKCIVVEGVLK